MKSRWLKSIVSIAGLALKIASGEATSGDTGAASAESPGLTQLRGEVESLTDSYQETKGTVDKLSKLKFGGYIQAQWQHADSNNIGSVAGGNFPGTSNQRVMLRRSRLKATYDGGTSQYILEVEALPSGFSLKDAEVVLLEPWLKSFTFTAGLMDRPFGFEIPFSSAAHEAPERTRVYQTVFPGEKDLGFKLEMNPADNLGFLRYLNLKAGLYTGTSGASAPGNAVAVSTTKIQVKDSLGNGIKDTITANIPTGKTAPSATGDEIDSTLDFIGRLGFKAPFPEISLEIDGGLSIYYGHSLSGSDTVYQMAGDTSLFVTTGNKNKTFVREAYGVDAQIYYDLPIVGGFSIRGEYLQGTMPGTISSSKPFGTSASAVGTDYPNAYMASRSFMGWYVSWIQNYGKKFQSVVKYDVYDPNTSVEGARVGIGTGGKLSQQDLGYTTLGFGGIYYWDGNLRFTVYYDMVTNESASFAAYTDAAKTKANPLAAWNSDLNDNVLTVRAQLKF